MNKIVVFDTSSIITIVTNNLSNILKNLKKNVRFFISKEVKKELVDYPIRIKRFKLEAMQVMELIDEGIFEVSDIKNKINFTEWLEYFTDGIIDELLRVEKILPKININPQTKLLPYHNKILKFIQDKGFITDDGYSKLTNRAKATRRLDLNKLISLKLIDRKGKGKQTHYKLKEK